MGKVLNNPNTPFRQHLQRLWLDVRYPFRINPLAHKPRKGWQDFLHALTNIPVETCRSFAYEVGHVIFYLALAVLVFAVGFFGFWAVAGVIR